MTAIHSPTLPHAPQRAASLAAWPGDLAVRPPVRALIDELSDLLDDWELADWFVEPHASLRGTPPWRCVEDDFAAVHDTARSLRFACGH